MRLTLALLTALVAAAPATASTSINYGSISHRGLKNLGDGDAVYLVVGGKDGYVGRDGMAPEGETNPRGPGFEGSPGAGPPGA